jgi:hypothetical protein
VVDWSRYAVGGAASRPDSFTSLDPIFRDRLAALVSAAEQELGRPLQITSAYRSPEVQARLYEQAIEKYGSPEAARKWVAPPGRSRHNSGTAADFAVNGNLIRDANSPEAVWLRENAARFGLSVPMDWEPWQVELAGDRDAPPSQNALAQDQQAPQMPMQANALAVPQLVDTRQDPRAFMTQPNPLQMMGFDRNTNPFMVT